MKIKKVYQAPRSKEEPANDDSKKLKLSLGSKVKEVDESKEITKAIRPIVISGIVITMFVVGFFGVWAGFAPLESAAIANGTIVLHENRKTIQHLEGGIIRQLLVKEGDEVKIGQTLLTLNATSANAQQQLYSGQLRMAVATETRLLAERDDSHFLSYEAVFPKELRDNNIDKLVTSQKRLFQTRRASILGQIDILQERIMQYNDQIEGLNEQIKEVRKQSKLISEEIITVSYLLEKGMEQKPRLLSLKRKQSELNGEVAKYTSEIATIQGSISEMQLQMINVQNDYLKDVMTELKDVQQEVADLREKLNASDDVLERTVIVAAQAGKVTDLQYHTIGGVITPGAKIMDIVPQNDKLIVEAQIKPEDVDIVSEGLDAKVMLSAYKSRFVPRLNGKVIYLSADRFTDENSGKSYYIAKIEINEEEIENLTAEVELYPGMPAESFIRTGESTLINYLASPIIDSFRRSFREQ